MPTYTLVIPGWHPASSNTWKDKHWAVGYRIKRADREVLYAALLQCDPPVPKALERRRVALTVVLGPGQRGCDPDNYLKSLLDGLKGLMLIVNDSARWVESPQPVIERGPAKLTRIVLEDLGPPPGRVRRKRKEVQP